MRMLVLLLAVLFVRHVRSFENETMAADVVIAFNVSDHRSMYPWGDYHRFFELFADDDPLLFGDEKIRVAVVQFSNDVQVLLPLQKGTSAAEIKDVNIDQEKASSENPMKFEEIAPAVRKAAFGPQSGARPTVPKIEIIFATSIKDDLLNLEEWKKLAESEASQLAADVVQIFHKSANKYNMRCSGSSVEVFTEAKTTSTTFYEAFKTMGKDAANRLKAFLKRCSYKKLMPCHYEFQECVARVDWDHNHNKYCRMQPCEGDAEECKKQCDEVSKWTDCKDGMHMRVPKNMDSETIFYWGKCMKFNNYSTMAEACDDGGDEPVRMIVALVIILLLTCVLVAVFVFFFYKKIYRYQLPSEIPKMVVSRKVVEPKSARNVKAVEPKSTKEFQRSPSRVLKLDNPSVLKGGSMMKKSSSKSVR